MTPNHMPDDREEVAVLSALVADPREQVARGRLRYAITRDRSAPRARKCCNHERSEERRPEGDTKTGHDRSRSEADIVAPICCARAAYDVSDSRISVRMIMPLLGDGYFFSSWRPANFSVVVEVLANPA